MLKFLDDRLKKSKENYLDIKLDKQFSVDYCLSYDDKSEFICRKAKKTKFLYTKDNTRIYFSDKDLISIIIGLEKHYIEKIMNSMYNLYNEEGNKKFKFMIADEEFEGIGIEILNDDSLIPTIYDVEVSIKNLTLLLSLIFYKERLASQTTNKKLLKRTLFKYIALIGCFGLESTKYRKLLEIEVFKSEITWEVVNEKKDKELDRLFNECEVFDKYIDLW